MDNYGVLYYNNFIKYEFCIWIDDIKVVKLIFKRNIYYVYISVAEKSIK